MSEVKPKIIFIDREREVHQINDYVSVCCNTRCIEGEREEDDIYIPDRKYYISFEDVRYSRGNKPYLDEDSPVEGGLSVGEAKEVIAGLQLAIIYIEQLNKGV